AAAGAAGEQVEAGRTPLVAEAGQAAVVAAAAAAGGRRGEQATTSAEPPGAAEPRQLQVVGKLGVTLQGGAIAEAAPSGRAEDRVAGVFGRGLSVATADRAEFQRPVRQSRLEQLRRAVQR